MIKRMGRINYKCDNCGHWQQTQFVQCPMCNSNIVEGRKTKGMDSWFKSSEKSLNDLLGY